MKKKILWIEDDADILRKLVRPLEKEGYELETIRTYSEYLGISEEDFKSFILIIIDLAIPPGLAKINNNEDLGAAIIKNIREERKADTPIIAMTGIPGDREYEFNDEKIVFFKKPILPSELQKEVHRLLNKR